MQFALAKFPLENFSVWGGIGQCLSIYDRVWNNTSFQYILKSKGGSSVSQEKKYWTVIQFRSPGRRFMHVCSLAMWHWQRLLPFGNSVLIYKMWGSWIRSVVSNQHNLELYSSTVHHRGWCQHRNRAPTGWPPGPLFCFHQRSFLSAI